MVGMADLCSAERHVTFNINNMSMLGKSRTHQTMLGLLIFRPAS